MKKIIASSMLLGSLLLASDGGSAWVLGVQTSYGSADEKLSNTTGTIKNDYDVTTYKLLAGKDFDLYGKGETSRFYGSYKYNSLSNDGESYNSFGLGYRENISYMLLLDKPKHKIFPYAGVEFAWATGYHDDAGEGFDTEVDLGLTYQFENMEFSLGYTYNYVAWDNIDASNTIDSHQATLGFAYKFINGEK